MADPLRRQACLLTALALLLLPAAAADDGADPAPSTWPLPPCPIIIVGPEPPVVDPHPECIPRPLPPILPLP